MKELLGKKVSDAASGFTGIAISALDHLNGNVQYGIQPVTADPAAYPSAMYIDYHLLDVVDDGLSNRITKPKDEAFAIKLGDQVEDTIVGHKGIATLRSTHLNGCVSYFVEGKINEKDGKSMGDWVDYSRLKVIEAKTEPTKAQDTRPPGGPSSMVQRRAVHR